ncbi:cuticle protein 18.6-like [Anastrepha obliqua]|uniref:cuticle protein 18.6-like n=1 Tax=Anastrepha obliqua TaxID=95512 RepID=UPI00240A72DC|nr:cuticle protein 18.6-like [Anastrepha obliqua]
MQILSCIAFLIAAALFGGAFASYAPHGHASSYAAVVQEFHHHHPDTTHDQHEHHKEHYEHHEPHHYPKYAYEYGVKDLHTGDHKSQWEYRVGDQVKGGYTFAEADGTIRLVEYTADAHNGFKAVVKRIGHAHHYGGYGHENGPLGHEQVGSYYRINQQH